MEEKNNGSGGETPKLRNMGFIDDYSSDEVKNTATIRRKGGVTVYSNPLEDETKPKRKITKNSRKRYRRKNRAYVITAALLIFLLGAGIFFIVKNSVSKEPSLGSYPKSEDTTAVTPKDTNESTKNGWDDETEVTASADYITLPSEKIFEGDLILVNFEHKYLFPAEDGLVSMYGGDTPYSVSRKDTVLRQGAFDAFLSLTSDFEEVSGCDDILVVSTYRTVEKQTEIYDDRVERYGADYAARYVALPGYSEHHTGLALDLSVLAADGKTYDIETYPECDWFNKNYPEYGYILRYPVSKASITKIDYEGWHYRYVGLPHSLIMKDLDLCLEEYVDYLRDFTPDAPLIYSKNSKSILTKDEAGDLTAADLSIIYYVEKGGDTVDIPLPYGTSCTVSGNNVDGFIVTVSKNAPDISATYRVKKGR